MEINKKVLRRDYLEYLRGWKDNTSVVKIITGIRRCGKSTLMSQFIDELRSSGVDEEHIIYLNFESVSTRSLKTYGDLDKYMMDKTKRGERYYVFFDEIQRVENWELTVNAMMVDRDADMYITGSNAYLLSSELSTYLSGRYVEIKMLPLSFREYIELHPPTPEENLDERFTDYIWMGAIPLIDPEDYDRSSDLLRGLYETIVSKDVSMRLGIRNGAQLNDINLFLFSNIGNITNCLTVAKESGLSPTTVKKYISALEDAYIFYKSPRFDIVGKKLLHTNEKYYVSDTGIRNIILENAKGDDISRQIENIVYLELRRRGYTVSIGSYRDKEVDFTAVKNRDLEYFQVTLQMRDDTTFKREAGPLESINDNFPKTILTMDRFSYNPSNGIKVVNVIDWLLGREKDRP